MMSCLCFHTINIRNLFPFVKKKMILPSFFSYAFFLRHHPEVATQGVRGDGRDLQPGALCLRL
jgi:hypothetical protein